MDKGYVISFPLKDTIDILYPILLKQQEVWIGKHWEDFNSKKTELESVVSDEFGKVVKEIEPLALPYWILERSSNKENVEILDYEVLYNPQFKEFRIKITKLKLPNGKIMDDKDVLSSQYGCPHVFLEAICGYGEIHPKVEEFKKKYSVRNIDEPHNDCEHK